MYEVRVTQIWLSDIEKLTTLMETHYKAPYVYYGAVHHAAEGEKDHAHIVLFVPENCDPHNCTYTNDEGNVESKLRWMELRAENGLIYPFHLKYSKTSDCFIGIDKKSKVTSEDCFGIIKEVPDNWYGYYDWFPFNANEVITSALDRVRSSKELHEYLNKNRGRITKLDCYKVMGLAKVFEYADAGRTRDYADTNDMTDMQMENFINKLG